MQSCLWSSCLLSLPQAGKSEKLGAAWDSTLSDAVKKALAPSGYRILMNDGSPICEVWLRENIPAQPPRKIPNAIYQQLGESTLMGVISFPQAVTGYRGEAISAGPYTMRYALLPNDGKPSAAARPAVVNPR